MGLEKELWLIGVDATSSVYACRLRGSGSVWAAHFQVRKCSLHFHRDGERHFCPINLFFSTHLDRIVPFSFCEHALWRELAPVVPAQLCWTSCDPQAPEGS